MEINSEEQWITDRLAIIEPAWHPDIARGRQLLDARLMLPLRRFTPWMLTAAAAICVVALALPATRAAAQELWQRFVLNRVDVVRLDLSKSPLQAHITSNGLEQSAKNIDEAEQMAGFKPALPAGILGPNPEITVTGPMVMEQTVHVGDLRSALGKLGVTDVQVPDQWDGVTFQAVIGPMVEARYPGQVQIIQAKPFSFSMPAGFPLERFMEVAFRSLGVSPRDAAAVAGTFAANPAWLVDIPPDEIVNLRKLSLVSGPALLIEKVGRATVIRSTTQRVYAVVSPSRDLSVKIANALP